MPKIAAIYGSPRRKGNTATLLKNAVRGARKAGAEVDEIIIFDVLEADLCKTLLFRGLDFEGDVDQHPEYLEQAYTAGKELVDLIESA